MIGKDEGHWSAGEYPKKETPPTTAVERLKAACVPETDAEHPNSVVTKADLRSLLAALEEKERECAALHEQFLADQTRAERAEGDLRSCKTVCEWQREALEATVGALEYNTERYSDDKGFVNHGALRHLEGDECLICEALRRAREVVGG